MTSQPSPDPCPSELDSAIIRMDLLQRSHVTQQPEAQAERPAPTDIHARCVRVDPRHRELSRQPLNDFRE
ncbi:MAG: hypothetical protein KF774_03120 [Planctomyces sp.]|nr:hypothetical protein [Planctomyces sp.]